jgi:hypothetical protein
MTESQRIGNIMGLGYTEREATFLCRAALHGGYFVRRQFLTFADCERGKVDTVLTDKALNARHVKELVFRYKRTVYSFCSKPFFEALGNADNRNRRTHEIPTIKSRLIGFDFVLANPHIRFVATEAEKVAFFHNEMAIGLEHLPAKRYRATKAEIAATERYFVDKFPVGVEADSKAGDRVVFTYIDDGDHSTSGFELYLEQYGPLFARVPRFRLVYASVVREHLDAARRLFDGRIVGGNGRSQRSADIDRLLRHFKDRDAYERKDLVRFDQRKLIQFREDRRLFSGARHDALFDLWRGGGERALASEIRAENTRKAMSDGVFSTWLSAFRYELFGTITSGNWRGES